MSQKSPDLSILLARREKRLRFWNEWFLENGKSLDSSTRNKILTLMKNFKSTLGKYALSESTGANESFENSLSDIERELNNFFDARRLMTSAIGTPAIEE
jgi:hypothetical protein